MRFRTEVAVLALALAMAPGRARADETPPPPPPSRSASTPPFPRWRWVPPPPPLEPWEGPDPALVTGLVLVAVAAGAISLGVADLHGAEHRVCELGPQSCQTQPDRDQIAVANGAIGAGGAIALVGASAVVIGTLDSQPATRRSNSRMSIGMVVTALGAAALTSGWVFLTGKDTPLGSAFLIPVSGALLGPGISLWVSGEIDDGGREQARKRATSGRGVESKAPAGGLAAQWMF